MPNWLTGFFWLNRRASPREEAVKQVVERRHMRVAIRLSKLNGHAADEILADAYRDAEKALDR